MTALSTTAIALAAGLALLLTACDSADLPEEASQGPNPTIPEPSGAMVPTVNVAEGKGWTLGEQPEAARGLAVKAFAQGLNHPRWLYVLPNGDVLVAETNGPERPEDGDGIKGWIMGLVMSHAGAGVKSPNKIMLLRDADGDGVA